MSIMVGDLRFRISDNNGNDITSTPLFQVKDLVIREAVGQAPTFSCSYDTIFRFYGSDYKGGTCNILQPDIGEWKFGVTVMNFSPGKVKGYLVSEEHVFERKSHNLADTLRDSIESLGFGDILTSTKPNNTKLSGCDDISAPDTFYQFNETDLECAIRLLDMSGQGTVWSICHDGIRIFPRTPQSNCIVNTTIGVGATVSFDRSKSSSTNFRELSGETSRFNIFYGRYTVPVPRLSKYSRDAVASAIEKRKERNTVNCIVMKCYNEYPMLEIGDSVHFTDWQDSPIKVPDFVVTARSLRVQRKNYDWIYEFTNSGGWT